VAEAQAGDHARLGDSGCNEQRERRQVRLVRDRRGSDGDFTEVGDVAGVDRERDLAIKQTVMRDGLMTGRRIERASASGVRPGYELRPSMVVTVRFEGIMRESTGALSLRDPKLVAIRSDKNPSEADLVTALEESTCGRGLGRLAPTAVGPRSLGGAQNGGFRVPMIAF
jgi:hypothetical protein